MNISTTIKILFCYFKANEYYLFRLIFIYNIVYKFRLHTSIFETQTFLRHQILKQKNKTKKLLSRTEINKKIAGLSTYFDFILTSKEAGYKKPDRKLFDLAMKIASEQLDTHVNGLVISILSEVF